MSLAFRIQLLIFSLLTMVEKDCSFFPLVNLWYPDYVTFESVQKAAHYLRMKDGRLVLDHYDGSVDFKEEASFKMNLKSGKVKGFATFY